MRCPPLSSVRAPPASFGARGTPASLSAAIAPAAMLPRQSPAAAIIKIRIMSPPEGRTTDAGCSCAIRAAPLPCGGALTSAGACALLGRVAKPHTQLEVAPLARAADPARLPGLDLLRALAIAWVMVCHADSFDLLPSDYFGWMG